LPNRLCARDAEELQRASADLDYSQAQILTVPCDIRQPGQVGEMVAKVFAAFGQIDIVVNNAGAMRVGPLNTMGIEDFREAMDVMFWGTVYTTLAVLPHFRERGRGSIINITSIGGKVSVPHLVPYSCAKFAAVAFSEGLHAELKNNGIQVVTIAPGLMRTGSYLNAIFKGAERGEAAWFSAGASLPGISMSATRAARQIVEAMQCNRAERILSVPANLLARFYGMFPELSAEILSLVNGLLPHGSERVERGADSDILRRPWMRAMTTLGRKAADEFLQPAAPR
jgi:short-subunit dehydrogenase